MIRKWKTMCFILGTVLAITLIFTTLLAGGVIGVSAKDGDLPPGQAKKFQPPGPNGYEMLPLESDTVKVAACQMVKSTLPPGPAAIAANLQIMLSMCNEAADNGARLAVFNEFTLTGFGQYWTREYWLNGQCITVPGPETQAIGQVAHDRNMYIAFASHFTQPEWPGHFFNGSILIGPSGDILITHWKAYWGYEGIGLEYSTTTFDVLDEFVKKYGWDAVWPVARTPIGNIAMYVCSETSNSEVVRTYAAKGAEIICRMFGGSGWGNRDGRCIYQAQGDAAFNDVFIVNGNGGTAAGADTPKTSWSGSSFICDPWGRIMVMSSTIRKDIVYATFPIGQYRTIQNPYDPSFKKPHMPPTVARGGIRTELAVQAYESNPGRFPPDLLTKYQKHHNGQLPPTYQAAREWFLENQRWDLQWVD